MPLYDYQCPNCKYVKEVVKSISELDRIEFCPRCDEEQMNRLIVPPKIRLFRAGYYPDLDINPVYVDSMKQLKAECKKRGLTSAYAEDMC